MMAQQLVFWNHAAEARYGWTKEEALGHSPHTLLQTVFPKLLAAIQDALPCGTAVGRANCA